MVLLIFGTICLIYTTGIISTDENLYQTSQCIQPIEYNISLEKRNTSLIVNSTVLLNVSCEQQYIRLQIGRYCNLTEKINVEPIGITNINYIFSLNWKSIRLQSSNSSKHRVDSVDIRLVEEVNTYIRHHIKEEVQKPIPSGLYTISSTCTCNLEEIATVFSIYSDHIETKETLSRNCLKDLNTINIATKRTVLLLYNIIFLICIF